VRKTNGGKNRVSGRDLKGEEKSAFIRPNARNENSETKRGCFIKGFEKNLGKRLSREKKQNSREKTADRRPLQKTDRETERTLLS